MNPEVTEKESVFKYSDLRPFKISGYVVWKVFNVFLLLF